MAADFGPDGTRDPLRALYEREQRRPNRRRLLVAAAASFVLGVFAIIVYYAYEEGRRAGTEGVAPLIKAEQQPYKVKPDEPGGTDVPGQDKLIYNEVSPKSAGEGGTPVERLMPPAEAPLPKPTDNQASAGGSTPAAPGAATTPAEPSASQPQQPGTLHLPQIPPAGGPAQGGEAGGKGATSSATASKSGASQQPPQLAARPQGGAWSVQLGAVRSSEEAQREWGRLQKKAPDVLGGLTLHVQRADLGPGKGVFYRIQAGPFADRSSAESTCGKLKTAQMSCLAVKP